MNQLTGIKDLDREILSKVNDEELLTVCQIDKRMWNAVCDDNFLRRRLLKYPGIEKYKGKESWKQFFLKVIYYVSLMKEEFGFDYTYGDFQKQYNMLKKFPDVNDLLVESSDGNELPLIIYALNRGADMEDYVAIIYPTDPKIIKYFLEKGADIHTENDIVLSGASSRGDLPLVKYLVEKGANIHADDDRALRWASRNEKLDVVQYLIEKGANINAKGGEPLRRASRNGSYKMVKYLVENGAEINTIPVFQIGGDLESETALMLAIKNGHLHIVKYLVDRGADIRLNDRALEVASRMGHLNIVKYLVSKGAPITHEAMFEVRKAKHLQIYNYLNNKMYNS